MSSSNTLEAIKLRASEINKKFSKVNEDLIGIRPYSPAMSIRDLNSFCIDLLLMYLQELDVRKFGVAFKVHQPLVSGHWSRKKVINFDTVGCEDAEAFLQMVELFPKVKAVHFTKKRMRNDFKQLPGIISHYLPKLEVLNIPGLFLCSSDLDVFSRFTNLKSLNIRYDNISDSGARVEKLFLNNPHLEEVCMGYVPYAERLIFHKIPKSIKKIDIEQSCLELLEELDFNGMNQLEQLRISQHRRLSREQMVILSKMTTLKVLSVRCHHDDLLEELFINNPGLVELNLSLNHDMSGECLKKLPKTIKVLNLSIHSGFEILLNCLKEWNHLQLLSLSALGDDFCLENLKYLKAELHLRLVCTNYSLKDWSDLQKIQQLKRLRLETINKDCKILPSIIDSFVELEFLQISWTNCKFTEELFNSIARLPKLKEIHLNDLRAQEVGPLIPILGKCKCLNTARFVNIAGCANKDVLELLQNCHHLKNLELIGGQFTSYAIDMINNHLMSRVDRSFHLKIDSSYFECINNITIMHPHFEIEFNGHTFFRPSRNNDFGGVLFNRPATAFLESNIVGAANINIRYH